MQLEVKINLILHATEDENKVLEKLEENFGIEQKDFQIEQIPGHFNNPISVSYTHLTLPTILLV